MSLGMDEQIKKPTITDELKALTPNVQHKNPLKDLPEHLKGDWEELKSAIISGKLNHVSMSEIHRRVCKYFNISIPRTTFRDFLAREKIKKPKRSTK